MMTVKEAIDAIEKDTKCSTKAIECANARRVCGNCELYVDPYDLDGAHETAFRIMQAWEKAKEDIRKACGCRTALDIMERYEKEEQIEPEKVRCVTCKHLRTELIQQRNLPDSICASPVWKELGRTTPHIIGHDINEPIRCDHWEPKKEGET